MKLFDINKIIIAIDNVLIDKISEENRSELNRIRSEIVEWINKWNKECEDGMRELENDRKELKEYYEKKIKNIESYPFGKIFYRKKIKYFKSEIERLKNEN